MASTFGQHVVVDRAGRAAWAPNLFHPGVAYDGGASLAPPCDAVAAALFTQSHPDTLSFLQHVHTACAHSCAVRGTSTHCVGVGVGVLIVLLQTHLCVCRPTSNNTADCTNSYTAQQAHPQCVQVWLLRPQPTPHLTCHGAQHMAAAAAPAPTKLKPATAGACCTLGASLRCWCCSWCARRCCC